MQPKAIPKGIYKKMKAVWKGAESDQPTDWEKLLPQYYGPDAKDPDEGLGEVECDDIIAKILQKFTGLGGTFSTWNERHAFIIGAQIGYLHVNKTELIPVPKFWRDDSHYFYAGVIMGRSAKKLEDTAGSIDWKVVGTAIGAALAGGTLWGPEVLKAILTIFGVTS